MCIRDRVIKNASLENLVNLLPEKINTIVGSDGKQISGGQAQRLAIARALYQDPDLIIFDEATNSLDEKTEEQIISILNEYIKPAVASEGGNIQFDSYNKEDKTVQVILQGACSGCPSSTFTLKNGIENMLKEMMPGQIENVVAING